MATGMAMSEVIDRAPKFVLNTSFLIASALLLPAVSGASQSTEFQHQIVLEDGHPVALPAETRALRQAEYQAETDLPGAIDALSRAVGPDSSAVLDFALGRMLARAGNIEGAIASMQQAGKKAPRYAKLWRTLGLVYSENGRYSQALDAFANLLSMDPHDIDALSLSGRTHSLAGAHDSAQRAFREALRFAPADSAVRMDLVRSLFAQGSYSAARVELEVVRKAEGSSTQLRLLDAQIALKDGNIDSAEASLSVLLDAPAVSLPSAWPETCFTLAWMLLEAPSGRRAPKRAAPWMRRAAEGNLPAGQSEYGKMLLRGDGVAADPEHGAAWIERAAQSGLPSAISNLGLLHMRGEGVTQDSRRAADLFRAAAEAGEPEACLRLGFLYSTGNGVDADDTLARTWWARGARAGHAPCAEQLASLRAPRAR